MIYAGTSIATRWQIRLVFFSFHFTGYVTHAYASRTLVPKMFLDNYIYILQLNKIINKQ